MKEVFTYVAGWIKVEMTRIDRNDPKRGTIFEIFTYIFTIFMTWFAALMVIIHGLGFYQ